MGLLIAIVLAFGLPGPAATAATVADHEIWALDQGTNTVHVYGPDLREITSVALDGIVDTPHMVDFDSQFRYAFIANTRSGDVAIIRTADYELVDVVETGPTAHMAAVTPDDSAVWVANIGGGTLSEIVPDYEEGTFAAGREIDIAADPLFQATYGDWETPPGPVCHQYTADSRYAYLTLGPGAGGLVVVDLQEGEIVQAFDPEVVRANCGVALSADGAKMYANWGSPDQDDGEWYVFDTATHELVGSGSSEGVDAHGVRVTPDGAELWMVNRHTDNVIVIDTETDEVVRRIDSVGDTPDILDFSPDGTRAYFSLRGPHPRSGAPHVATGSTPGFSVVDTVTGEIVALARPAREDDTSDFHGIGVRVLTEHVTRLAGADRIGTAVVVSQAAFGDGEAGGAVLARADAFPDALAGAPLATAVNGPLLLTDTHALPDAVAAELTRVLPAGAGIEILGGLEAISEAVAEQVRDLGFAVRRVGGSDRFVTASEIADAVDQQTVVLLASGRDFPDALAAGAAAAHAGGVVLLTDGDAPHGATNAWLDRHHHAQVYAVGGPAARAHPEATPLFGSTRVETAVAIADEFFPDARSAAIARADDFPDALAGGAFAARQAAPILLTATSGLDEAPARALCERSATAAWLLGGPGALSAEVERQIGERLTGAGC